VAFLGAIGTVLSFTVMLFILFFIIRDGRAIARLGSALVPLPPDRREALADRLSSVTRAVVRGTVLTSIIQGLLLGIGFALAGMPAPVVFGVLAAVLSVVPFGGTALVWGPALIAVLIQGNYGQAVGILVVGVFVSSVDNFIKPMLISGRSPLPTLAVFIGVLGGLAAFGLIGLFVGPIVIALVLALIEFAKEQKP
jgi:predicted PurR-regulated permease PerM